MKQIPKQSCIAFKSHFAKVSMLDICIIRAAMASERCISFSESGLACHGHHDASHG